MTTSDHPLERFLPLLVAGDADASDADLAPDAVIYDPQAGAVAASIRPFFLPARYMWLAARRARVESVRTVRSAARVIVEQILHLVIEGGTDLELPVALAAETDAAGLLARVRVYHASQPLLGRHDRRGPIVGVDVTLRAAEPVSSYLDALGRGDLEAVLGTFAEDATLRSDTAVHAGPDGRRAYFADLLAGGGLALEPCTVTDDGAACALEHTVSRWGDRTLAPHAGLTVFERATPRAFAGARIYDDARPPSR
jgi:hypothetical protein